jgi:acetoin utilization protein AcuB
MLVKDQMTPNPACVTPADTLAAAMEIMGAESFRELPVVEDGRLVGILSDRDLQRHWGHLGATQVSTAMTPNVVTIESQAKIEEAARLLLDLKIGGLPVVEEGSLVGMITVSDIVRAFLDLSLRTATRTRSSTPRRKHMA